MHLVLFNRKELVSMFVWSFFSFSVIRIMSVFIYFFPGNLQYFLAVVAVSSILCFLNYYLFKIRFSVKLNYQKYITCCISFGLLITVFAYGYYLLIRLPHNYFEFGFYARLFVLNLIIGSILYLFTLIKKRAV